MVELSGDIGYIGRKQGDESGRRGKGGKKIKERMEIEKDRKGERRVRRGKEIDGQTDTVDGHSRWRFQTLSSALDQ